MAEDDAFRVAVLAQPFDPGPRLVWADRLDELGNPRGAWLRHWCAQEDAALAVPLPALPAGEDAHVGALDRYPGHRGLLAAALAGLTPLPGARRARDLLPADPPAAAALAAAGLRVCGLLGGAGYESLAGAVAAA